MKNHSIEELNKLYSDSETCDKAVFAEQRSNILLYAGEHYAKKGSRYWNRIRDAQSLSEEQKVRITRNHVQKAVNSYVNAMVSHAPGVIPTPKNERELQDAKAAELNKSVWKDVCDKHNMDEQVLADAFDFVTIGEVAMKVTFDYDKGRFLGWNPEMDEETGMPSLDENGQMVKDTPRFAGDFVFERIYGFNLLRPKECKNMKESPYYIVQKMVDVEPLKAKFANDPDKQKTIQPSSDKTYLVFNNGSYESAENQCLLKEYYFKPCYQYPMGYYYITNDAVVLYEGELPEGIFPIIYEGFNFAQTSPRGYSQIRNGRPAQIEINRAASKVAEHQISGMGDDKLLHQSGTKLSEGSKLPGVRGVQYSGMKPEIMEGRTGEQYVPYIASMVTEFYNLMNLQENQEDVLKQADPMGMLFFSIRDKKKFSIFAEKFERFQKAKCELVLRLAKLYYTEEQLIPAIGKTEIVNISEFKNTIPLSYEITLKPMTNDMETMFGKYIASTQILQYVGNQLAKEDIGRIIRNMPFGNNEENYSTLTLNYDTGTNLILALDRGEQPEIFPYDDHAYLLKRITYRMRQSDFVTLDPQIKMNYQDSVKLLEMQQEEQLRKLKELESEFIPSGGAMVKVDYYVQSPTNPGKTERATLPAESVDWLIKRLASQGSAQKDLLSQGQGVAAEIGDNFLQQYGSTAPLTQGEVPTQPLM